MRRLASPRGQREARVDAAATLTPIAGGPHPRPMRSPVPLLAAALLGGCFASPGDCDPVAEALAYEVVYTEDGLPAFAGQAMLNRSCGNGQFCHTEGISAATDRNGAPSGLDFDLPLAAIASPRSLDARATIEAAALRLAAHQERVYSMRGDIWGQVTSGSMPPRGEAGDAVRDRVAATPGYDRLAADGATFSPLPGLDTDEGREILRSWLACGVPVVDRTIENAVDAPVGAFVPVCERSCVDATWDAIYAHVITPSCAIGGCHAPDEESRLSGMLDMSGGAAAARLALVDVPAMGEGCSGPPPMAGPEPGHGFQRVTPGDSSASLLFVKISAASSVDVCGGRMPSGTIALSPQRACAIAAWIDCGAHADGSCDDPDMTLEQHRAACNIPPGGGTEACLAQEPCARGARP